MSEEKSFSNTSINWYPGHMAKTKRQISEMIHLIDVVLEVVDARIPKSSKIIDIDNLIKNKPKILIMTKYDLCDKSETDKFIGYYENFNLFLQTEDFYVDLYKLNENYIIKAHQIKV